MQVRTLTQPSAALISASAFSMPGSRTAAPTLMLINNIPGRIRCRYAEWDLRLQAKKSWRILYLFL